MKNVPVALANLAAACLSLFTDDKKKADQVGGFNHFRGEIKKGLLGKCIGLSPYRIKTKVLTRTQELAAKVTSDDPSVMTKLKSDHPAASLLADWIKEFLSCAQELDSMGVAVKGD